MYAMGEIAGLWSVWREVFIIDEHFYLSRDIVRDWMAPLGTWGHRVSYAKKVYLGEKQGLNLYLREEAWHIVFLHRPSFES